MVEIEFLIEGVLAFGLGCGRSGNSSDVVSIKMDGRVGLSLVVRGPRERSTESCAVRLPIKTSR